LRHNYRFALITRPKYRLRGKLDERTNSHTNKETNKRTEKLITIFRTPTVDEAGLIKVHISKLRANGTKCNPPIVLIKYSYLL